MVHAGRRSVEYLAVGPAEPAPRRHEAERAQSNLCSFCFKVHPEARSAEGSPVQQHERRFEQDLRATADPSLPPLALPAQGKLRRREQSAGFGRNQNHHRGTESTERARKSRGSASVLSVFSVVILSVIEAKNLRAMRRIYWLVAQSNLCSFCFCGCGCLWPTIVSGP
jgi:hypothetical protein